MNTWPSVYMLVKTIEYNQISGYLLHTALYQTTGEVQRLNKTKTKI